MPDRDPTQFVMPFSALLGCNHKVLTSVEYRAVSGVFQNIDPPPPLHPASVSSPRTKGTRRAVRGWGSIFSKTPDIGLVSYSIIPLRLVPLNSMTIIVHGSDVETEIKGHLIRMKGPNDRCIRPWNQM
jgi:hypothetical protein